MPAQPDERGVCFAELFPSFRFAFSHCSRYTNVATQEAAGASHRHDHAARHARPSLFVAKASESVPSVTLSYAAEFDQACAQQTRYQIDRAWVSELTTRLPEFTANWAKDSPALLRTSEEIVGKPFQEKQL